MFPFGLWRRGSSERGAKQNAPIADVKAFERQFPGVQLELRELRARIEANSNDTEPLLDRARYFLNSRLPSNRFNCADDCSRALELDPFCAPAYALRAQSLGDTSHPNRISGRWPSRAALDYLCAYALDSQDTASRTAFLRICAVILRGNSELEIAEELGALKQLLGERIGHHKGEFVFEELASQIQPLR